MSVDLLHDDVAIMLRAGEHRYTTGRRQVVATLHAAANPVTIPQILEVETSLAQSSVYRNLAILEEVGVVARIVTHDDYARYELAEKLTDDHHHHLICTTCGAVSDFELPPAVERTLDSAFTASAAAANFQIEGHRLDLIGSCANCL
ncbi:Fur family transcriptional regulator [uncultured Ilumatobacter sp.]|uniref:Fur family transcriptional regulator n=1 Tax=uncultured Ilumatobacter sp. TaxID=879968 RepID=UPI00374F6BD5